MQRKLPDDVKRQCLAIVQGYDRRRKWYLRELEKHTPDLENHIQFKQNRAVNDAKLQIGLDIEDEALQQKLIEAIMINCEEPRRYPYEYLGIDGIGRGDFYNRRTEFLYNIAKKLYLL